ncbi:MAG TPA: hypothetical protein VIF62_03805 [Labilithrix sp.]|jgi:hypothetical protein
MKRIAFAALALLSCSSSSSTVSPTVVEDAGGNDAAPAMPCGPNGPYGTTTIQGTLNGTESICGLSLGSFTGATLAITKTASGGTSVTVANSGMGHIDVADCKATLSTCKVTAACAGSTDMGETVSLSIDVHPTEVTGTSSLGFNGCQAPGLSFTGMR